MHYAIGDIQGCQSELEALLEQINFRPKKDTLLFVGDLVCRGPRSLDSLRFVKSLGESAITVLGNHDLHLIYLASFPGKKKVHKTLQPILDADDCHELIEWLRFQSLAEQIVIPEKEDRTERRFLMSHAGLPASWSVKQALRRAKEIEVMLRGDYWQDLIKNMYGDQPASWNDDLIGADRYRCIINHLTRMRFCHLDGSLEFETKGNTDQPPKGCVPWFEIPRQKNLDQQILFGHWAALQGKTGIKNLHALDTGCVWGGWMTAMRLEDGKLFHQPSLQPV